MSLERGHVEITHTLGVLMRWWSFLFRNSCPTNECCQAHSKAPDLCTNSWNSTTLKPIISHPNNFLTEFPSIQSIHQCWRQCAKPAQCFFFQIFVFPIKSLFTPLIERLKKDLLPCSEDTSDHKRAINSKGEDHPPPSSSWPYIWQPTFSFIVFLGNALFF